jgi:hypothetical protein
MNTTTYAAFDETAIWGTGATPEAAIDDAVQWVNAENAADLRASCSTAIMTPELAALVDAMGGNVGFGILADGRLGTSDQQYEQA